MRHGCNHVFSFVAPVPCLAAAAIIVTALQWLHGHLDEWHEGNLALRSRRML